MAAPSETAATASKLATLEANFFGNNEKNQPKGFNITISKTAICFFLSPRISRHHDTHVSYEKTATLKVSHYLDHIQPAIDELASREKHLFVGLDPTALPEECAVGEHSLARMQCFHRFQQLVAEGVDHWCRQSNVTEVLGSKFRQVVQYFMISYYLIK